MKDKAKDKTKKSAEKKKADKKHRDDLKDQKVSKDQKSEKKKKGKKHRKGEKSVLNEQLSAEQKPEAAAGSESSAVIETGNDSKTAEPDSRKNSEPVSADASGGGRKAVIRRSKKKTESGTAGSREAQALVFRALGDESRLQILDILQDREMCAADLLKLLPIVQSTLSHHMKILCEAGLVICRKQGRWSYYTVNGQLFEEAADRLRERAE